MNVAETIYSNLSQAFKPKKLEVIDESHLHIGHVGARPKGQTHYKVIMSNEPFEGQSRVERGRAALRESKYQELKVHAIEFVFEKAE